MITPAYGLTATERVLPSFTLDWTTGLVQPTVDVTRAGVATFIGSNGLIQSASADTQRIDYGTGVAGLLVEENRTNLILESQEFSIPPWTQANLNVSGTPAYIDVEISPDGTQNADKIIATTTNGQHYFFQSIALADNTVYAATLFAKAGEYTTIRLGINAKDNSFPAGVFNLSNGTFATVGSPISVSMTPYGNGWYRCVVIFNSSAGVTAPQFRVWVYGPTGINFAGDNSSGLYLWGAQLEAGAFPTSYIPTEASAVTRNADVATVNDISWLVAGEGSLYSEHDVYATNIKTQGVWQLYGGATTTSLRSPQATTPRLRAAVGGAFSGAGTGAPITANTFIKAIVAWDGLNGRLQSGSIGENVTAAAVLDATEMSIGALGTGSQLNGHIKKIMYWPYKLTIAELQAFSS